jgi:hypothetical protein
MKRVVDLLGKEISMVFWSLMSMLLGQSLWAGDLIVVWEVRCCFVKERQIYGLSFVYFELKHSVPNCCLRELTPLLLGKYFAMEIFSQLLED